MGGWVGGGLGYSGRMERGRRRPKGSRGVLLAVLGDESLDELGDLVLLPAGKLGSGRENQLEAAFDRGGRTTGGADAEEFLDADSQGGRHGDEHVGTGSLPGAFPVTDVGRLLVDAPGEFAHGEAGRQAQFAQGGLDRHAVRVETDGEKSLHMCSRLHISVQCNHA